MDYDHFVFDGGKSGVQTISHEYADRVNDETALLQAEIRCS